MTSSYDVKLFLAKALKAEPTLSIFDYDIGFDYREEPPFPYCIVHSFDLDMTTKNYSYAIQFIFGIAQADSQIVDGIKVHTTAKTVEDYAILALATIKSALSCGINGDSTFMVEQSSIRLEDTGGLEDTQSVLNLIITKPKYI